MTFLNTINGPEYVMLLYGRGSFIDFKVGVFSFRRDEKLHDNKVFFMIAYGNAGVKFIYRFLEKGIFYIYLTTPCYKIGLIVFSYSVYHSVSAFLCPVSKIWVI